jgi:hypothetical protein
MRQHQVGKLIDPKALVQVFTKSVKEQDESKDKLIDIFKPAAKALVDAKPRENEMSYGGFLLGLIKVSAYHHFMQERKDLAGSKRIQEHLEEFQIVDKSGTALEEFLLSI